MGPHYLTRMFSPRSVVVYGASDTADSLGRMVFQNLLSSSFGGEFYAVNLRHRQVAEVPAYHSACDIGKPVDLAVIATPPKTLPDVIKDCAKANIRFAVIVSQGLATVGEKHASLLQEVGQLARKLNVRLLGPNLFGLMRPRIGLNVSTFDANILPGNVALVSQSTALASTILDWAKSNQVGFSSVVSLGASVDLDVGEVLDYLVNDNQTRGILLYLEGVRDSRNFMSALRAASRAKPVIVIKAGRTAGTNIAARTHSGAMVGRDEAFEAALRRAGAVRVRSVVELFAAARVLTANYRTQGKRLAIVTNGAGPGVMAADRAADLNVNVARLNPETIEKLNKVLPSNWSHGNPVDIIGDADPARFQVAVEAVLADENVDAVVVNFTPQMKTDPIRTAEVLVGLRSKSGKPILPVWMGEGKVAAARKVFNDAKMTHYRTPEHAIEVFYALASYFHNQQLLLQVPGPLTHQQEPRVDLARMMIEHVLAQGRTVLTETEAKAVLAEFHIPVNVTRLAKSADEAVALADEIGYPVVLKVESHDILHKTDVGGVVLNLETPASVRQAYADIQSRVRDRRPDARLSGITVQPMIRRCNARELMVGVVYDKVFGPLISFGTGGVAVEVIADRSVALPPLNEFLVSNMIRRTRAAKMLGEFRNMPPVNMEALQSLLLRVSELVCELPHVQEIDINPVLVDENGVLAVDARIIVRPWQAGRDRYSHMAIYPYPSHLENEVLCRDGMPMRVRPIRPEDAAMHREFFNRLSDETRYNRLMNTLREMSPAMLVRFTQLDYAREMALIGVVEENGEDAIVGVARYASNPDRDSCEFALTIRDDFQGKGLGRILMEQLFDAARQNGLTTMEGEIFANNTNMLKLMTKLGFELGPHAEDPGLRQAVKIL